MSQQLPLSAILIPDLAFWSVPKCLRWHRLRKQQWGILHLQHFVEMQYLPRGKNMTTSWTHGAKQNWTAWIIQTEFLTLLPKRVDVSPWNFITDLENANVITNPFGLQATMWLQQQQWSCHLLVEMLLLPRLKNKKVLTTKIDFSTTAILKFKTLDDKNGHKCTRLKMRKSAHDKKMTEIHVQWGLYTSTWCFPNQPEQHLSLFLCRS